MPNSDDSLFKGPYPLGDHSDQTGHIPNREKSSLGDENFSEMNHNEEETRPEDFEKFDVDKVDQLEKEKEEERNDRTERE